MSQLPLPLAHRAAVGRDDFLVATCNEAAVAWLDRWPQWPGPALLLIGDPGCGKSHLAHVFASRTQALVLSGHPGLVIDPPQAMASGRALVVDDADNGVDETMLFHLYNLAKEWQRSLLLTCKEPPACWVGLPDLRSRLMAAPAAVIGAPDDGLMAAILGKLFTDRQIRVGEDVITYLLRHMERSYQAAVSLVEAADRESLAQQRPVTVPLIRSLIWGS